MTQCPTCGFDLWKYNRSTYTCKHGHRFDLDGEPVPSQPVYTVTAVTAQPVPAPLVAQRLPLAVAAACGAGAALLVDLVLLFVT